MVLMVRFKDDDYYSKEDRLYQYSKKLERDEIINITYDKDSIVLFYWC